MKNISQYLEQFKPLAKNWFAEKPVIRENFEFFREFFKIENLEKAEWLDIQKLGEHLYCFQSMAIAKRHALGNLNHPIEYYRQSFSYLAHGAGEPAERLRQFTDHDSQYHLMYFGPSAVSELAGYLFPDQFLIANSPAQFAVKFLEIAVEKVPGKDRISWLQAFAKATQPVTDLYEQIVGHQTDLPLKLEVDQFFRWLYENVSDEPEVQHWWLQANPNIWDFESMSVGHVETYTSHNEKGNKRRIYRWFKKVKPGDIVVGYVTSPVNKVVAICQITKSLQQTDAGGEIEFKKVESLSSQGRI